MAGVLNIGGSGPPPAPNPDAGQNGPSPSNGVLSAPGVAAPPMAPAQGPGQGQGPPTPTHGQTVAALRHFNAIKVQLAAILKNPALGKSNLKAQIVDGMANLVASRILTPGAAVQQLTTVPDKPFDQKKWLQTHLEQATGAQMAILAHHGAAFGGVPEHLIDKSSDPDDHISDMAGLQSQYGGARG